MTAQLVARAVVVIAVLMLTVSIWPRETGAQGSNELASLRTQVSQLYSQGKYAEATPIAERYVALARQKHGDDHTEYATAIDWLARVYDTQGRYAEAEPLFKHSLAIREKALGPDHPDVGSSLNNLAVLYEAQGRYAESEPLKKRALAIREKVLGPNHPEVGESLNNLASLYHVQGRYAEAEPLYRRSLDIWEKAFGPDNPSVAAPLNNLAGLYEIEGRYADAEPLYKRALAIREKAQGPDHPEVGAELNNLASLYKRQGRYADAEPLYKRSLAVLEKSLGPDNPKVGATLDNLAALYQDQGRYTEAEPLVVRSVSIFERALGPDHPDVAISLNNLAGLYYAQGRYLDAVPLYLRCFAIWKKAQALYQPNSGSALNNLASVFKQYGRYDEAEEWYKLALAIREKALGPGHPDVGQSLNNLAILYQAQGRYAEAEPLYQRSFAIWEKALGQDHPSVAILLNNLASMYESQSRYAEAEPLYKRALAIREKALGPDHPDVSSSLNNLAYLYFEQRDWVRAVDFWRRSTTILVRRAQRGRADVGQSLTANRKTEAEKLSFQFWHLVKAVNHLALEGHGADSGLQREMFQTAQWALSSEEEAATSLAQMAARGATGDVALSPLIRERQDLVEEWQKRDQARSAAVAQAPDQRDRANEAVNLARMAAIDTRITEIDQRLKIQFPNYAALTRLEPLSVAEVQAELLADEALVLFLDTPELKPTPEETFIWVITKGNMRLVRIEFGTTALTKDVIALRCGLDDTLWDDAEIAKRCEDALGAVPTIETVPINGKVGHVRVPPFDLVRAYDLYKALLGPVEDMIKGKRLLIVPSGPLTILPFNVLITESGGLPALTPPPGYTWVPQLGGPSKAIPGTLSQFRHAAWLGTRTVITVLPSVSSLKALRRFAKKSRTSKPYLGVGNPLLDGEPGNVNDAKRAQAARDKQQCPTSVGQRIGVSRPLSRLFRGSNAEIEDIRQSGPLPETADELCAVARQLGVPESEILLGANATEARLKDLSVQGRLADYAIVHFATHGALSGQVEGAAEPGLILTPPAKGTTDPKALERDDGFLTASEIAILKLDADWVILSACNTAAGGAERFQALSGLARAFFYAGARSLLVSHWAVDSDATVKLITKALSTMAADKSIGRSEALRRSMLALIETGESHEAHPAFWAPFVVVGEGAAAR
jgi:CHAT domain-containing protein/tetratricopeptide (TPR) repeat protein